MPSGANDLIIAAIGISVCLVASLIGVIVILGLCILGLREKLAEANEVMEKAIAALERQRSGEPFPDTLDGSVLNNLHRMGANLAAVHAVDFVIDCNNEADAKKAADQLQHMHRVTSHRAKDGSGWVVTATHDMVPKYQTICDYSKFMTKVADSANGNYSGWGTKPVYENEA